MNFIDSYFESISGFTTTGFSILQNIRVNEKWQKVGLKLKGFILSLVKLTNSVPLCRCIPNLLTKTLRNAKIEISRLNLGVDTIIYEYDNDMKDGTITFQIPKAGRLVQTSTNMTLGEAVDKKIIRN